MYRFSLKVMKNEKEHNRAFLITMILLTTIECIFFQISNHPLVTSMEYIDRQTFNLLTLLIIAFSFFITFYLNSQYLDYKRKELGLLYLSGSNLLDIGKYLFIQYLIIFIIAVPLGMIIASLCVPVFYKILSLNYPFQYSIFSYNSVGYIESIVVVLTKILYIIIVDAGFIYRNEIIEIIKGTYKKKNKEIQNVMMYGGGAVLKTSFASFGMIGVDPKKRNELMNQTILDSVNQTKLKKENNIRKHFGLGCIFLLVYILSIIMMFIKPQESYTMYVYINIAGTLGIIYFFIPSLIGKLHNTVMNKNPIHFVSLNDLLSLLQNLNVPIMSIAIIIPYIINLLSIDMTTNFYRTMAAFGYIVLTIILAGALYFKNSIYIQSRENEFLVLDAIGYNQDIIKKIIYREVIYTYLIATVLPIIVVFIEIIKMRAVLSLSVAFIFVFSYILIFLISFILTLVTFLKKYVRKEHE